LLVYRLTMPRQATEEKPPAIQQNTQPRSIWNGPAERLPDAFGVAEA
jgi:hypothetical protein